MSKIKFGKKSGFTLIELLVVIAIIALLSAVVLVALTSARQRGRDAQRISDIRQLRNALQLYYTTNKTFPTSLAGLVPTYISKLPTDPLGNTGAACRNGSYCYSVDVIPNPTTYHVGVQMEVTTLSNDQNCNSLTGSNCQVSAAYVNNTTSPNKSVPFNGSVSYIYDLIP
ncbi:MAG: prepilin-type N-terminal cleavage/methylation domain-containing protein [Candidatus Pacebacteria bacterium]|nr:prepilin-type N-terminal cleavage/methylation domain-containing protein [Candidatus Paceibacterota bacterium]